jgi:hypothetical protein
LAAAFPKPKKENAIAAGKGVQKGNYSKENNR